VGCAKPAFEQGRNQVNMGEVLQGSFGIAKHWRHPMAVSSLADAVVSVPIIRMDGGPSGDRVLDETDQTLARSIRDMPQANASDFLALQLDGDHHQRFADQLTPPNTAFLTSNVGFVDFHGPGVNGG